MADSIGLTTRRVQAIFADHVGLSPKTLSRIARLQRALAPCAEPAESHA